MILAPLIWLQQVPDVFWRGLVIQVLGCVPAVIKSEVVGEEEEDGKKEEE